MDGNGRRWYVTVIASFYLILCSVCSAKYILTNFGVFAGTVPMHIQLLCYSMVISAALYFIRPKAGHIALLIVTALTLIVIGETQPKATYYHLTVLLILLFPLIHNWRIESRTSEPIHSG